MNCKHFFRNASIVTAIRADIQSCKVRMSIQFGVITERKHKSCFKIAFYFTSLQKHSPPTLILNSLEYKEREQLNRKCHLSFPRYISAVFVTHICILFQLHYRNKCPIVRNRQMCMTEPSPVDQWRITTATDLHADDSTTSTNEKAKRPRDLEKTLYTNNWREFHIIHNCYWLETNAGSLRNQDAMLTLVYCV